MALDAASAQFIAGAADPDAVPIWEMTPTEARGIGAKLKELFGAGPDMARVENLSIPSSAGGSIQARLLVGTDAPQSLIVYFHGGGWVTGAIDDFDAAGRTLAATADAAVLMVDYRKAPEHPYPGPVEDSWSAVQWASENRHELGLPGAPLVVAGDSAGGNLAAVCALRSMQPDAPEVTAQVLVYPVMDADFDTASYLDPENQLLIGRQAMIWFWDHYIPDIARRSEAEASPLHAESLVGAPPAIVLTAEHDPLRDEGDAFARRLADAGVDVQHRQFAGQMHGFFTFVNVLPGSVDGMQFVADGLARLT
ncbi:alpha/beta hydrolase [Rhodococcus sp. T2V]|uniref:alpha/beta hydrolase n=1 Tax=Rhodococcus sp. T2V TaxID=3034164 RepID=UPI0023E120AE|nr:alpha/beta hydrolase [Rhodococcus sp. T2V]MDF3312142.1 alpha/beta hydrolase [Rhodococcus sp. T2V]